MSAAVIAANAARGSGSIMDTIARGSPADPSAVSGMLAGGAGRQRNDASPDPLAGARVASDD